MIMHKNPNTTRYCCKCKGTTRWVLVEYKDGYGYRCIGDDDRHPERGQHGCGDVVVIQESNQVNIEDRL